MKIEIPPLKLCSLSFILSKAIPLIIVKVYFLKAKENLTFMRWTLIRNLFSSDWAIFPSPTTRFRKYCQLPHPNQPIRSAIT
jgi:hypothetical protein